MLLGHSFINNMSPARGVWLTLGWLKVLLSLTMAATIVSPGGLQEQDRLSSKSNTRHFVNGVIVDTSHTRMLLDEPYACENSPFAIIFVHSAPVNGKQRDVIRRTWGSISGVPEFNTKVLFIIGMPTHDSGVNSKDITNESKHNRDILQLEMTDVYANLTVKSVAMLQWAGSHCPNVKYVIKTDDDTFLNTPLLIRDLRSVVHTHFMMGDIIAGARPIRDIKSKYFTPVSEFNGSMYPTYLSGAAYVISGDLISELSEAAQNTELFWLEDVYITGLLARRIHAKQVYNGKFGFRIQSLAPCQLRRIIALHRINCREMANAWTLLNREKSTC